MKCILFIVLLLPSFLWSQEVIKKKNSIQIIKGIGVGHRILGTEASVDPTIYRYSIGTSSVGVNYRFGIDYQRQIVGGLFVKAGTRFSLWSLNNVSTNINDYDCLALCYLPPYPSPKKVRQYYIEAPFALQYKFGSSNKLQFYIEAGVNPMLGLLNNGDGQEIDEEQFYIAVQVAAGLSYELSNNCSLFGQISSRVQTKELILDENFNYGYLYEIGLELGAAFYF